jgi:AcrR family transcriptional regulator
MSDTTVPYETTGRSRQKGRTRAALLAAAWELLAEGVTPTVEQAADRGGVSRTTAYRYFPNQRELLLAAHPVVESASLLGDRPPTDPIDRLDRVLAQIGAQILDHEVALRAALRISLGIPAPPRDTLWLRQGRVVRWLEDALSPLRDRLGRAAIRRLAISIRAAFGVEPFVWLVDVAGLSRRAAIDLMHASAITLLRAAIAAPPGR